MELAKTAEDDARERVKLAETPAEPAAKNLRRIRRHLHAARVEQAELHGANAAQRGRVQELDGECQAAREEIAVCAAMPSLEQDTCPSSPIGSRGARAGASRV